MGYCIYQNKPEEVDDFLTSSIIGAAIDVHRILGPGLLESAYENCFAYELRLRNVNVHPMLST